ncbi:hypothetical protein GCM10011585_02780 [Edaphobacter dinghuensis]|uniref:Uncharacterized protein n=1 Tax=Edaphobacter dinghuensis TaxID=1560005 RepID=A0A917LXQ1_9BACT|nr:hypothetical protein GCM10011585_02780 [Edaphobacter dinghuensis]
MVKQAIVSAAAKEPRVYKRFIPCLELPLPAQYCSLGHREGIKMPIGSIEAGCL